MYQSHSCPLSCPKDAHPDSDSQEQIYIKNIETGQTHSSICLNQELSPLAVKKASNTWQQYFKSVKELENKLLQFVMKKEHSKLEELLVEFPIELNQMLYFGGWTLLHFATNNNDHHSAQTLLKFGLDPNLQTEQMKRTCLHQAVLGNKIQFVELLIGWSADPNVQDADRNTAMHFAVDYSYIEVVKALLASAIPVDLELRNNQNMTAFNNCRLPQIFEILITYNSKLEKHSSKGSKKTAASKRQRKNSYQSRLIIRNSDVIPHSSRADMVEKFLSLRENPIETKHSPTYDTDEVISEQSYEEGSSLGDNPSQHTLSKLTQYNSTLVKKKKNKIKKIGSELKSTSVKNSFRIASQNIGLMRQSLIKDHLQNEESIDNYDRLRRLGQGAFAEVLLVRKKRSSVLLALKEIDKARVADDSLRRYVYAQRFIYTHIKHPFILHAEYCLQDFTHLYILTEFCVGGDLQKQVRETPLSQNIARTYLCEAALGLQQVHSHGMLYRDLKVSNVLLDALGHLRLADFGLAKQATSSTSFLGSMNYLAPQMLVQGIQKPHDKSLDWYLLGIFLFEILHGLPPFYCEDRAQMQQRVLHQQVKTKQNLSQACNQLIKALMTKDPKQRLVGLQELKKTKWLADIDWQAIYQKKGEVIKLEVRSMKQLRKKEYMQDMEKDYLIDDRIQWYQDWNYPSLTTTQSFQ